jgi:hypothetical protein
MSISVSFPVKNFIQRPTFKDVPYDSAFVADDNNTLYIKLASGAIKNMVACDLKWNAIQCGKHERIFVWFDDDEAVQALCDLELVVSAPKGL